MQLHLKDESSSLHKNYAGDQLTDWIPGTIVPERPGLYQLRQGSQLYNGKFDGAHWTMFQGVSSFRLSVFQLKSIKWRGLNFQPPVANANADFSKGWVFDSRDPRCPRPLIE
jgi:hypothetical protein